MCDDFLKISAYEPSQSTILSSILDEIIMALHQLNENSLPMNWLYFLVISSSFDESHELNHVCHNYSKFFEKDNNPAHIVTNPCECSILDNIFRYNMILSKATQKMLGDFFISLFSIYEFKQDLIKTYSKMFHFLFEHGIFNVKVLKYDRISELTTLDTQLFTSEELSIHILNSGSLVFTILDEIATLLDNHKSVEDLATAFFKIFSHLKHMCSKEAVCITLINLEGFLSYFCTLISKMQYIDCFELPKSMVQEGITDNEFALIIAELDFIECAKLLLKAASEG
jgi:hypothetical protein